MILVWLGGIVADMPLVVGMVSFSFREKWTVLEGGSLCFVPLGGVVCMRVGHYEGWREGRCTFIKVEVNEMFVWGMIWLMRG